MSEIPQRYFDDFFDPLVGDEESLATFRAGLYHHIAQVPVRGDRAAQAEVAANRYAQLEEGLEAALDTVLTSPFDSLDMAELEGMDPAVLEDRLIRQKVITFALDGLRAVVGGIDGLGQAYAEHATRRQQPDAVRRSQTRMLQQVYGMAFTDAAAASMSFLGYRAGQNPHSGGLLNMVGEIERQDTPRNAFSPEAFAVAETSTDPFALDIRLRFANLPPTSSRRCPSTESMNLVDVRRTNLSVMIGVIGDVALEGIYPYQFRMAV